jgi:hypothetical protein
MKLSKSPKGGAKESNRPETKTTKLNEKNYCVHGIGRSLCRGIVILQHLSFLLVLSASSWCSTREENVDTATEEIELSADYDA